jgi:DNA-binding LacI/PurR family transcriptional regulator
MEGNFSKVTLGEQIATYLKDKIKKNEYKDGMLPKEEDLAVQLNVSRGTVRSAMAILEEDDLIIRVKKRGTMIRGFSLQFPDLKSVKRINLFYYGNAGDFYTLNSSGFYGYVFNAILAEASKQQYILNVGLIEGEPNEKSSLKKCLDLEAEGNILLAMTNKEVVKKIIETNKPTIIVDHEYKDLPLESVNVNSYQGSYEAVKYLYQRGHRKLLYIDHYNESANPDRGKGVRDAIRDLKIPSKNFYEVKSGPKFDQAYEVYTKMKKNFPAVTGILTFGPEMAHAFIKGLEDDGFKIPQDYSVISSGNISNFGTPTLTTVEFDLNLLGKIAVSRLTDMIRGTKKGLENEQVRGFVVERGSVQDVVKT